jgi:tellurite methyltransferase
VTDPPGDARRRWNRRYRERGVRAFEKAPSPWVVEHHALLTEASGRRALDVACGEGGNAGYLADLGFDVDAVDVSDVAIDALREAAVSRGLSVHPRRADLERGGLPTGRYGVIVQIHYLQRDLFGPLSRALTLGGLLILQTFTRADREELGNGVDARYLLEAGELPGCFPELEVIDHREAIVEHGAGRRAVAGLVARRR